MLKGKKKYYIVKILPSRKGAYWVYRLFGGTVAMAVIGLLLVRYYEVKQIY